MKGLEFVGWEFLGITAKDSNGSSGAVMAFPRLKRLHFFTCQRWGTGKDITADETGSATTWIMPCLRELKIEHCGLTKLPHRLLHIEKKPRSMADAIVSIVLQRLAAVIQKQIQENVLEDAERRRYKDKTIQNWLNKLEDVSNDIADVLDEWNYAILKHQIERLSKHEEKSKCDLIVNQPIDPQESARVRSTFLVDVLGVHGRENDKDVLVGKLMLEVVGQQIQVGRPQVIFIVGVEGIGKTTLAQLIYNDDRLLNCFELKLWVCVSDVFDEVRIAKAILESVKNESSDLNELESLLNCLKESISEKKFLLVLEDVWTEEYTKWEPLENSLNYGGPGSKILVTTRSKRVARMMHTTNEVHRLGQLSNTDCWLLMKRVAFYGKNEADYMKLQETGKKIANKCKGLPFAAKVLGSLLRFKNTKEEWESILDYEIWQLEGAEIELFPHLFLSYNELSPAMKQCFSYCAIFPKDSVINVEKLIRMWMALGYLSSSGSISHLELRGKEYFNNLRMRSFFQDVEEDGNGRVRCKMHDMVHDFARFLRNTRSEDLGGRAEASKDESFQAYGPSLVSQAKVYRSIFCPNELPCELLDFATCTRVLSLCKCGLRNTPRGIENLIHLRYLDLSHNGALTAQVSLTICRLYNLETLDLYDCGLREIPIEIGNLIELRYLDLSCNELTTQLPRTIFQLFNLQTLNLKRCRLKEIPTKIGNLINLRDLDLRHNKLTANIPRTIGKLHNLQTLRLKGCKLTEIPMEIGNLIRLRHLDLSFNKIQEINWAQTLHVFYAGKDWSNLGYLNKLDQLSGSLELKLRLRNEKDVNDARKAKLMNKIHIQKLKILFYDATGRTEEEESLRNEALEALQPPPNLRELEIGYYKARSSHAGSAHVSTI
ncbi:putative disease resistance protein RGA3 [Sesamum alatum]|uniref:Disease resistance protein RGA3 n=1 Tax=Sesamum alatum TaxID=300844 RepID=A0AAE1YBZ5_9LAMI|nr:putative disease resistance protein RGA3 [Sesamum alatum]